MPPKKKLTLPEILADPGKAITELLGDPEVADKVAAALSKLPPTALEVLATKIAEHMPQPATAKEIAANLDLEAIASHIHVTLPEANEVPPTIAPDDIIQAVNSQLTLQINEVTKAFTAQITKIFEALKAHADNEPLVISGMIEKRLSEEAPSMAATILDELKKRGIGSNGDGLVQQETAPPPKSLILGMSLQEILSAVVTMTSSIAQLKAASIPVASLAEDKLKAYATGFASGNKMRAGALGPDEVANEMLNIAKAQNNSPAK